MKKKAIIALSVLMTLMAVFAVAACRPDKEETKVTIHFVTGTNEALMPLTREVGSYYGELPIPERAGYDFIGWFTAVTGGTEVTSETVVTAINNHSLYARWDFRAQDIKTNRISAGSSHTLAIDPGGNLWAWGANGYGQIGDGTRTDYNNGIDNDRHLPMPITQGIKFSYVSAGGNHTLAIDQEGNLWAWGRNNYGQIGDGTVTTGTGAGTTVNNDRYSPIQIMEGTLFSSVSAGDSHNLAIDIDGNLWAWGYNEYGKIGDGTFTDYFKVNDRHSPVRIKQGTKFLHVSAGGSHSLAIDTLGNLWAWGRNNYGQLGDGTTDDRTSPVQIMEGTKFLHVSAGFIHSLAIDTLGNLWAWGRNNYGQLGDGTTTDSLTPVQIMQGTLFSYISAGNLQSLAIDTLGNLWAWGRNNYGQLGDGTTDDRTSPVQIMEGTKFSQVAAGASHTLAIDIDGNLWAWGSNNYGHIGDGTTDNRPIPVQLDPLGSNNVTISFDTGTDETFSPIVRQAGLPYFELPRPAKEGYSFLGWFTGETEGTQAKSTTVVTNKTDHTLYARWEYVETLSIRTNRLAAHTHSLMIDVSGNLWAWGHNNRGQLGDGTTTNRTSPVQIMQGTLFSYISVALYCSFAIDVSGSLWAWGSNTSGGLGDGTTDNRHSPVQIMQGTLFSSVSAGDGHTLAIDMDGNLWAWGRNGSGQLGDGTTADRTSPVQIMRGTKFTYISAGNLYSLAIDVSGNLWAWGYNNGGQLGTGNRANYSLPVQIMEGTLFSSVSAGDGHTLAIDMDGNLWAWGRNGSGQLGDGTTADRTSPVQIMQGTLFSSVSAGSSHSLAIDSCGNLWAWGSNFYGSLGDGTTTRRTSPVQIVEGTLFSYISAGNCHNLAIDMDGNLWAWGRNGSGQLGDGTTTDSSLPVQITYSFIPKSIPLPTKYSTCQNGRLIPIRS